MLDSLIARGRENRFPRNGYCVVRYSLGALLIAASSLKAEQFAFSSEVPELNIFLIGGEVALASWLLSGEYPRGSWLTAVICFSAFGAFSFFRWLSRADSCGCFGEVHVSPLTACAIDAASIAALVAVRHDAWVRRTHSRPLLRLGIGTVGSLVALTMLVGVIRLGGQSPDGLSSRGGYTVVDVSSWEGRPLPLMPYIRKNEDLQVGSWALVLYRDGCDECRMFLDAIRRREVSLPFDNSTRLVLVRVPDSISPSSMPEPEPCAYRHTSLRADHKWVITVPLVVGIRDGVVRELHFHRAPPRNTKL